MAVVKTIDDFFNIADKRTDADYIRIEVTLFRKAVRLWILREISVNAVEDRKTALVLTRRALTLLFGRLKTNEERFLRLLLQHPGAFVTHQTLLRAVFGRKPRPAEKGPLRPLRQLVYELRRKLEHNELGRCIETVRGTGFRWNPAHATKEFHSQFDKVVGCSEVPEPIKQKAIQ